jgi:anti-sigma-K factor RskA
LWNSNKILQQELERQEAAAKQQIALTERARAIAALLTSPQTVTVNLAPKAPMATESGRVMYNSQQGALIYAGTLPQLAADKSYELWVIPQTGNPIPAGVFSAQPNGEANVVLPSIPAGVSAKAFAVTIEPAGGTAAPTGPMAQVGSGL